jgi:RNA recognition motif-containing protein
MATKLYVGNLPYETTQADLEELFAPFGTVASASVITDKFSGRSKGFGFVEMSTDEEAQKAVAEMNGKEISGRAIVVNEARPMEPRQDNFRRDDRGGNRNFRQNRR